MAMPKTKTNRSRQRNRRATYYRKGATPTVTTCPACGASKRAHRACLDPDCGIYVNAKGEHINVFERDG